MSLKSFSKHHDRKYTMGVYVCVRACVRERERKREEEEERTAGFCDAGDEIREDNKSCTDRRLVEEKTNDDVERITKTTIIIIM